MKRCVLVIVVASVLLSSLVLVTPQGRSAGKTLGLVLHVLPGLPVKTLELHSDSPTRTEIHYKRSNGYGTADIYMPHGTGIHAAVLLSLGVNPAGRDDTRLVNLSEGLARAGMVVMIPWSEDLSEYRIGPGEIDDIKNSLIDFCDNKKDWDNKAQLAKDKLEKNFNAEIMGAKYMNHFSSKLTEIK